MKKSLLAIVILLLTLSGCTREKTPVIENSIEGKTISESDLFERKKECAKYMEVATEKVKELTYEITESAGKEAEFKKIFYSPKANSCLYTVYIKAYNNGLYQSTIYSVYDALSGEEIFWTYGCKEITDDCDKTGLEGSNEFRDFLREYE